MSHFAPDDVLTVGAELTVYGQLNSCKIEPDDETFVSHDGTLVPPRELGQLAKREGASQFGNFLYFICRMIVFKFFCYSVFRLRN